jgi:hypothetical protein
LIAYNENVHVFLELGVYPVKYVDVLDQDARLLVFLLGACWIVHFYFLGCLGGFVLFMACTSDNSQLDPILSCQCNG